MSRVDANTDLEEQFRETPITGSQMRALSISNTSDIVSFMSMEEEVGIT